MTIPPGLPLQAQLTPHEEREVGRQLLGMLMQYAPNGTCQAEVARVMRDAEAATLSYSDVVKMLAGAVSDGLYYGNWPWAHLWHNKQEGV
jgi:hypothetical protein